MGGKVYDRKRLTVDRDPTHQLAVEIGKLPKLDPLKQIQAAVKLVEDFLLDAFKTVTGIDLSGWAPFLAAMPGFDASKIITGVLSGSLIPGLDASKIVSGAFNMDRINGLAAALAAGDARGVIRVLTGVDAGDLDDLADWVQLVPKLAGGLLSGSIIPGLDASKIVSGSFAQSRVTGLATSLAALLPRALVNGASRTTNIATDPQVKNAEFWKSSWAVPIGNAVHTSSVAGGTQRLSFIRDFVNGGNGTVYQATTPGRVYELSVDAELVSGTPVANNFRLFNRYQNVDGSAATIPQTVNGTAVAGSKVTVTGRFTAPATGSEFMPMVEITAANTSDVVIAFSNFKALDVTEPQSIIQALFGGPSILSSLTAGVIPLLDASKIGSGQFGQNMVAGLPAAIAAALTADSPLNAAKLVGSVASSLLSGTLGAALIPPLDASKITSGQFAQSMLSITSIAADIVSGVLGVGNIPTLDAGKIGSGTFAGALIPTLDASKIVSGTLLSALIPPLDASKITTGSLPAGVIPILEKSKIADLTADLSNLLGISTEANAAAADAMKQLAELRASNNAAGNSGTFEVVDFSDDGAIDLFTKILDQGAGTATVIDGRLDWSRSGGSSALELYLLTGKPLVTDYFEVSAVMPRRNDADPFTNGGQAFVWLLGRANAAGTQLVAATYGYNTMQFKYANGGAILNGKSAINREVPGGTILTFRGGTLGGGLRVFQSLLGNTIRDTWVDDTNLTAVGPSNRLCGLGLNPGARFDNTQNRPGSVSLFTMSDSAPAPVVGQVLSVYRNAGNANIGSGDQPLPNGFFDMVEAQTSDIAWNAATSTATVLKSDTYTIDLSARVNTAIGSTASSRYVEGLIFINGGVKRRQTSLAINRIPSSSDTVSAGTVYAGITKSLYLPAGSTIRPGVGNNHGTIALTGNANGDYANMTIVRGKQ